MDILIAGDDTVALTIAEALIPTQQVVFIHPPGWHNIRLEKLGVETVVGPISSRDTLTKAHPETCSVFVACTGNDDENIVACLAARHLGAKRTICVLSRSGFEGSEDDDTLADYLGVDVVVRPSEQLSAEIIRIATIHGALDIEFLANGRVTLLRYLVEDGAPITDGPISEIKLPRNVTLVMNKRGDKIAIPRGGTRIQSGDKITAIGTPRGIRKLLARQLRVETTKELEQSATIVGAGVVGLNVARGLEAAGWTLKIIESDLERCKEIAPLLPKSLVLHGDGTDMEVIEDEHVGNDPVLIAVTDNDEKNLLVSMMARSLGVKRIITRATRLTNEKLFERVGIDVVRSAHGAVIRAVVRDVVDPRQEIRAELEHGDIRVLELTLPDKYPKISLQEIQTGLFSNVGAVVRGRKVIIARGNTVLHPRDHLFVFCKPEDEQRCRDAYINPGQTTEEVL